MHFLYTGWGSLLRRIKLKYIQRTAFLLFFEGDKWAVVSHILWNDKNIDKIGTDSNIECELLGLKELCFLEMFLS